MAQIEKMMESMALASGRPTSLNPAKEGRQNIFETRYVDLVIANFTFWI